MKIVFFGSSEFSLPFLKFFENCNKHEIVGVVTTPAKPKGRGRVIQPTCIEKYSDDKGYHKFTPTKLNDENFYNTLKALAPDMLLIASYGKYIPKKILNLTPLPMNIHPSLLPKYRGPNPVLEPILAGEKETGVTIMKTTEKMDAGDIASQDKVAISEYMTGSELEAVLIKKGTRLLEEFLTLAVNSSVKFVPQNESEATQTKKTKKEDTRFNWGDEIVGLDRKIRAYLSHPRAFFNFRNKKVFVEKGRILSLEDHVAGKADPIIQETNRNGGSLVLELPYGKYLLEMVAPEGKRPMKAYDFIQGYRLKVGDSFA